jgi:hypothetical protein
MTSNTEAIMGLLKEVGDLRDELRVQNALDERTDQFRRATIERVGSVFGSKPAMAFYVLLVYTLLSIFGMDEWARALLQTAIGPSAPIPLSAPDDEASTPHDDAPPE